jgi:hypothetical protein
MPLSSKAVLSILGVSDAVFLGLMQNFLQVPCSFKVAIRKSWIVVNLQNSKYLLRSNAEGFGCRTY